MHGLGWSHARYLLGFRLRGEGFRDANQRQRRVAGPEALPNDPGEVFADNAYRGPHFGDAVHAKVGTLRIVAIDMLGRDEAEVQARLALERTDPSRPQPYRENLRNLEA